MTDAIGAVIPSIGRADENLDQRYALFGDYPRLHCPKCSRSTLAASEYLVEWRKYVQSCRLGRLFLTRARGNNVFAPTAGLMQVDRRYYMDSRLEYGENTRNNPKLSAYNSGEQP